MLYVMMLKYNHLSLLVQIQCDYIWTNLQDLCHTLRVGNKYRMLPVASPDLWRLSLANQLISFQ